MLHNAKDSELRARAARVVPGGMWGHQNAANLPEGYPQFFSSAQGCRIRDVDGNEYIDFMCSWGPVLLGHHHPEVEEAAATLGASRIQTFFLVILPAIAPALVTGFALAFARGVGEYGSVIFISGNMPGKTEIAPLLIVTQLEQYAYDGATAIATVMMVVSFVILVGLNAWQAIRRRRLGA